MGRSNGFDMAGFQQSKPVVTMSNSNGISTMFWLADAQYNGSVDGDTESLYVA